MPDQVRHDEPGTLYEFIFFPIVMQLHKAPGKQDKRQRTFLLPMEGEGQDEGVKPTSYLFIWNKIVFNNPHPALSRKGRGSAILKFRSCHVCPSSLLHQLWYRLSLSSTTQRMNKNLPVIPVHGGFHAVNPADGLLGQQITGTAHGRKRTLSAS